MHPAVQNSAPEPSPTRPQRRQHTPTKSSRRLPFHCMTGNSSTSVPSCPKAGHQTSATAAAFTDYASAYEFVTGAGAEIRDAITVTEPKQSPVRALGPDGDTVLLGHAVAWVQKPLARYLSFTRPDTATLP